MSGTGTDLTPPDTAPSTEPPPASRIITIAGVLVSTLAALFSGILEIFLSPWHIGRYPVGAAVPLAVIVNVAIAWFAVTTTGHKRAIGAPWLVWTALMFFAAGARRPEGDYLISGDNWVALVMILAGSLAFAVVMYRMILRRPTL